MSFSATSPMRACREVLFLVRGTISGAATGAVPFAGGQALIRCSGWHAEVQKAAPCFRWVSAPGWQAHSVTEGKLLRQVGNLIGVQRYKRRTAAQTDTGPQALPQKLPLAAALPPDALQHGMYTVWLLFGLAGQKGSLLHHCQQQKVGLACCRAYCRSSRSKSTGPHVGHYRIKCTQLAPSQHFSTTHHRQCQSVRL